MDVQLDRLGNRLVFEGEHVRALFPAKQRVDDRLHLLADEVEPFGVLQQTPLEEHIAGAAPARLGGREHLLELLGFELADAAEELAKALGEEVGHRERRLAPMEDRKSTRL